MVADLRKMQENQWVSEIRIDKLGTVMWRGIAVIVPNHRIHVLQLLLQITILRMISRSGQPFLKL